MLVQFIVTPTSVFFQPHFSNQVFYDLNIDSHIVAETCMWQDCTVQVIVKNNVQQVESANTIPLFVLNGAVVASSGNNDHHLLVEFHEQYFPNNKVLYTIHCRELLHVTASNFHEQLYNSFFKFEKLYCEQVFQTSAAKLVLNENLLSMRREQRGFSI